MQHKRATITPVDDSMKYLALKYNHKITRIEITLLESCAHTPGKCPLMLPRELHIYDL